MIVAAMLTLCSIVMTQTACSHKDNSVNSAYDKLQEEKVVFVNHPYLKICRDKIVARLAQEK